MELLFLSGDFTEGEKWFCTWFSLLLLCAALLFGSVSLLCLCKWQVSWGASLWCWRTWCWGNEPRLYLSWLWKLFTEFRTGWCWFIGEGLVCVPQLYIIMHFANSMNPVVTARHSDGYGGRWKTYASLNQDAYTVFARLLLFKKSPSFDTLCWYVFFEFSELAGCIVLHQGVMINPFFGRK